MMHEVNTSWFLLGWRKFLLWVKKTSKINIREGQISESTKMSSFLKRLKKDESSVVKVIM